jgi:hypothetical protein
MRDAYIIDDIQNVILSYFKSLSAPWTSWELIADYPAAERFEVFTKPIIYFCAPTIESKNRQYGGKIGYNFNMIIGVWTDIVTGGPGELNVINSNFLSVFADSKTMNTGTFPVTFGATTYANQTLVLQGVKITNVDGPREIQMNTDLKEWRSELTIQIKT